MDVKKERENCHSINIVSLKGANLKDELSVYNSLHDGLIGTNLQILPVNSFILIKS